MDDTNIIYPINKGLQFDCMYFISITVKRNLPKKINKLQRKTHFYLNFDSPNGYINIFNKAIIQLIKLDLIYNPESKLG